MAEVRFSVPITTVKRMDRRGSVYLASDVSGYETMTWRGRFNTRARRYHRWCQKVRVCALASGFLKLPLPSRDGSVQVDVVCWFPAKRHPEPENVRKGIVDALYYPRWLPMRRKMVVELARVGHLDRFVYGRHGPAQYSTDHPRVEVRVTAGSTAKYAKNAKEEEGR